VNARWRELHSIVPGRILTRLARNYLFTFLTSTEHEHGSCRFDLEFEDLMLTPDSTDMRILRAMQEDGSLPVTQLAERAGISQAPCSRRIQAMAEAGIILGKSVDLDRRKLGFDLLVETRVKLQTHDPETLSAFKTAIAAIPEVQSAHLMLGEFDYRLQVVVRDIGHYQQLLQQRLTALPAVKEMQSSVVVETVKQTSALPL
jgi:DNA-binding Lrp family transcriptional regulator